MVGEERGRGREIGRQDQIGGEMEERPREEGVNVNLQLLEWGVRGGVGRRISRKPQRSGIGEDPRSQCR